MSKYSSFGEGLLGGMKTVSDIQNQQQRTAILKEGQAARNRYYDGQLKLGQEDAEFQKIKYDREQELLTRQNNLNKALAMMPGEYYRVQNGGQFSPEFYKYAKDDYLNPALYLRPGVNDALSGLMNMAQSGDFSNQAQASEWLNTVFGYQLGEGKAISGLKRGPNGGLVLELDVDGESDPKPVTLFRSSHPRDEILEMKQEPAMKSLMTMAALSQAVNRPEYRENFIQGVGPHLYTEKYREPIIQAHNQKVRQYHNIRAGYANEIDKWQKDYLKNNGVEGDADWQKMEKDYKRKLYQLDQEYGKEFDRTAKRHSYLFSTGDLTNPLSTRARSIGNEQNDPDKSGTGTSNAGGNSGGNTGGAGFVDTGDLGITDETMAQYEGLATSPFMKLMGDAWEGGVKNVKSAGQFALDYHPMGAVSQWVNRKAMGTPEEQAARAEIQKLLKVVQNRSLPEARRMQAKQQMEMIIGNLQQKQAIAEKREQGIPVRSSYAAPTGFKG